MLFWSFLGFVFERFSRDFKNWLNIAYRMNMEEADKVRFIREGLIEQKRLKLKTAQGKRIIPVLLRLQNSLNDIEYVFFFRFFFFRTFSCRFLGGKILKF